MRSTEPAHGFTAQTPPAPTASPATRVAGGSATTVGPVPPAAAAGAGAPRTTLVSSATLTSRRPSVLKTRHPSRA